MADETTVTKAGDGSYQQMASISHLDDEKNAQEGHFVAATLHIGDHPTGDDPEVAFAGPGLSRDRPGSVYGRQSIRSTSSRTSMRPSAVITARQTDTFFSHKPTAFENGVEKCKPLIKSEVDGDFIGAWLLTDIDHWDLEREKLVFLTKNSLLLFKYNFITEKLLEFKRILLHCINSIVVGDIKYPESSLMGDRQHGGVQINWNNGEVPTFGMRWNPLCTTIPWIILAHHPLIYNEKERETAIYNVDDFFESLIQQLSKVYEIRYRTCVSLSTNGTVVGCPLHPRQCPSTPWYIRRIESILVRK